MSKCIFHYRVFQCSAYNATMSVITRLQDNEKFYAKFLFEENFSKSEFIWSRILDEKKIYKFPLEVENFAKKRRKIVAIRKKKKIQDGDEFQDGGLTTMQSHYLSDSSLSQTIDAFDFTQSFVNVQGES